MVAKERKTLLLHLEGSVFLFLESVGILSTKQLTKSTKSLIDWLIDWFRLFVQLVWRILRPIQNWPAALTRDLSWQSELNPTTTTQNTLARPVTLLLWLPKEHPCLSTFNVRDSTAKQNNNHRFANSC
jgi:hypothetical protein